MNHPKDVTLDEYLEKCVTVRPESLEEEFRRLPAELAYWNAKYAAAYRALALAEAHRRSVTSRTHLEMRERLKSVTEEELAKTPKAKLRQPTVGDIEALVEGDELVILARRAELEAECEKVRIQGAVEAVRTKKDMLVSLGAHIRAEMEGDPVLREQVRGASVRRVE